MMNPKLFRGLRNLPPIINRYLSPRSSSSPFAFDHNQHRFHHFQSLSSIFQKHKSSPSSSSSLFGQHTVNIPLKRSPTFELPFASRSPYSTTTDAASDDDCQENLKKLADSNGEVKLKYYEEEEDETVSEAEFGDGGYGGGVNFQNCPWGEKALSIAQDVLSQFCVDLQIFAFKTYPQGKIRVRLESLSDAYGWPNIMDIKRYGDIYKEKLDEAGAAGDISPSKLGVQVFFPFDRLLKIPKDLQRFKSVPMGVMFIDDNDPIFPLKKGILSLESIDVESRSCIWSMADVEENLEGTPLTREEKNWRLKLSFEKIHKVIMYPPKYNQLIIN